MGVDSIVASTTADLDVDAHLSHFTTMGKFKETVEAEMRLGADGVIQQGGTTAVAISIAAQDTQITLGPTMLVLTTMESKKKGQHFSLKVTEERMAVNLDL